VRRVLALVAMALMLAACGIKAEQSAHVIDRHSVPSGLMSPASTTTEVLAPTAHVAVYLEGEQHLVIASRTVSAPATLGSALTELAQGVTSAESAQGLISPVSTATPISLTTVNGTTAVVNVASSFADLGGQDQIIAAAQIVYTLTLFPGVGQVTIRVRGRPAQVPTETGRLSPVPLTREDYANLAHL
jgi:spore germination protein GerM